VAAIFASRYESPADFRAVFVSVPQIGQLTLARKRRGGALDSH